MIRFLHSGASGDVIASLSLVKEICDERNDKAIIILDVTGGTSVNSDALNALITAQTKGRGYNFTRKNCEFIKSLIEYQYYVDAVEIWDSTSEKPVYDINLNEMRLAMQRPDVLRTTNQNIEFLYKATFNKRLQYTPWLQSFNTYVPKPVCIARSTRYQSAQLFFAMHEDQLRNSCYFIGTQLEYEYFINSCSFNPVQLKLKNALDAAAVIKSSDIFISNDTLFYWIGIGLSHPKIIHELGVDIPTTYYPGVKNVTFIEGGHRVG